MQYTIPVTLSLIESNVGCNASISFDSVDERKIHDLNESGFPQAIFNAFFLAAIFSAAFINDCSPVCVRYRRFQGDLITQAMLLEEPHGIFMGQCQGDYTPFGQN